MLFKRSVLFSGVIGVNLLITSASKLNVIRAKLSVSFINLTKYFKDSFTNLILSPLILPDTSTMQIKSTPFIFWVLSSLDNVTTKGVKSPVWSTWDFDLWISKDIESLVLLDINTSIWTKMTHKILLFIEFIFFFIEALNHF